MVTAVTYRGLAVCGGISLLLVFGLATAETHMVWLAVTRLTLGGMLLAEGFVLSTNWRTGRRTTVQRLQLQARRRALRSSPVRLLLDLALQLVGVLWLGGGLYLLVLGLVALS